MQVQNKDILFIDIARLLSASVRELEVLNTSVRPLPEVWGGAPSGITLSFIDVH